MTTSFWHRVKSFLITLGSLVGGAIVTAAINNPEAVQAVILDIQAWVGSFAKWASLAGFVGLVLNEIVREVINRRKIKAARSEGYAMAAKNSQRIELY